MRIEYIWNNWTFEISPCKVIYFWNIQVYAYTCCEKTRVTELQMTKGKPEVCLYYTLYIRMYKAKVKKFFGRIRITLENILQWWTKKHLHYHYSAHTFCNICESCNGTLLLTPLLARLLYFPTIKKKKND